MHTSRKNASDFRFFLGEASRSGRQGSVHGGLVPKLNSVAVVLSRVACSRRRQYFNIRFFSSRSLLNRSGAESLPPKIQVPFGGSLCTVAVFSLGPEGGPGEKLSGI